MAIPGVPGGFIIYQGYPSISKRTPTVDARNPFRTTLKPWLDSFVRRRLPGNRLIPGFLSCDFWMSQLSTWLASDPGPWRGRARRSSAECGRQRPSESERAIQAYAGGIEQNSRGNYLPHVQGSESFQKSPDTQKKRRVFEKNDWLKRMGSPPLAKRDLHHGGEWLSDLLASCLKRRRRGSKALVRT